MPNAPETYALMLAAASLGAVFSSTSPDFGVDGVVDRFGQIEPTVLVAADGYHYGGKRFDCLERLREIRDRLPSVATVVVLEYVDDTPEVGAIADAVTWDDWLAPHAAATVEFAPLPFDHPWYVLFSSGTTGAPKCIVHRAGGVLLKHLVRAAAAVRRPTRRPGLLLHDRRLDDVELAGVGARERRDARRLRRLAGAPRRATTLFDLTDELGITLFGTSARFLDELRKAGVRPRRHPRPRRRVRTITSTGSPLVPEGFDYVYDAIKADVHLASISGGTDLCGCLVGGDPTGPVWRGRDPTARRSGMAIDVVDADGDPLAPGRAGRARVQHAVPLDAARPLGRSRRRAVPRHLLRALPGPLAPGRLRRVDRARRRGDPRPVRRHAQPGRRAHRHRRDLPPGRDRGRGIVECLVIGQDWEDDTRVVLLRGDARRARRSPTSSKPRSAGASAHGASPRHVPAKIIAVTDLPRTRSNKLSELAVRDVVHGRPVANTEALANPEALDAFRDLEELARA